MKQKSVGQTKYILKTPGMAAVCGLWTGVPVSPIDMVGK